MAVQHDMKNPRLPCKTRLASNPCNGVNTGSILRCKTAVTNKMESKKLKQLSHVNQDVQVPPTDEGQRTNNMHQAKPCHPAQGEPGGQGHGAEPGEVEPAGQRGGGRGDGVAAGVAAGFEGGDAVWG